MLLNNKKLVAFLLVLALSLMLFSGAESVRAQTNQNYYAIPTATPFGGNSTETGNSTSIVGVSGFQSINPNGTSILFPLYAPASVTLSYATAVNYYVNVSSYDSQHNEEQSPNSMTVFLYGLSTYEFSFNVFYAEPVNQNITIVFSGNSSSPISIPLTILNSGFSLNVIVTTSQAPSYPSAQSIWDYGNGQEQQMITNQTRSLQSQQAWMQTEMVIGGVVVAVLTVVVAIILRWSMRKDRRDISQQFRGFGNQSRRG
jgi:hypothetical protein